MEEFDYRCFRLWNQYYLLWLSTSFYLTLFFLFCEGAFDSVSVIIRSTIMQLLTPDQMRGRVSAVNSMFIGSSNEIGAFESGLNGKADENCSGGSIWWKYDHRHCHNYLF
jgi:hypothetical protein